MVLSMSVTPRMIGRGNRGSERGLRNTAAAVVRATPEGERFLAPPLIEEVATATQIRRFPVYVRKHYLEAVGHADKVPANFYADDRTLLAGGMSGDATTADPDTWRQALDRVAVATVCTDRNTDVGLRRVVMESFRGGDPRGIATCGRVRDGLSRPSDGR